MKSWKTESHQVQGVWFFSWFFCYNFSLVYVLQATIWPYRIQTSLVKQSSLKVPDISYKIQSNHAIAEKVDNYPIARFLSPFFFWIVQLSRRWAAVDLRQPKPKQQRLPKCQHCTKSRYWHLFLFQLISKTQPCMRIHFQCPSD